MLDLGIWAFLVRTCEKIQPGSSKDEISAKILALRLLLITSLIFAAACCSVLAYFQLRSNETYLFESQYYSITESAANSVVDSFDRMNLGLNTMSTIYSHTFPDAGVWPLVAWSGFQQTATILGKISSLDNIAFSPLVWPEKLPEYEKFITDFYKTDTSVERIDPFPQLGITLGMSWALQNNLMPYHDVTGVNPWSPVAVITPTAQFTYSKNIGPNFIGFNIHADGRFGLVMDQVMECAAASNASVAFTSCGAVSGVVTLPFGDFFDPFPKPTDIQAFLVQPIFPQQNLSTLVGFMSGALSWRAVLEKAVPSFVNGLDCVITNDNVAYTYTIVNGAPVFRGEGDLHDRAYSKYKVSSDLDPSYVKIISKTQFSVSFYPREAFVDNYTSDIPIFAAVLLVVVFIFCYLVFLAYDITMQREFGRKQAVLDTKRRFVRFISHEIRTPMNTIRLGLTLFDEELRTIVKVVAVTALVDLPALINRSLDSWQRLVEDVLSNSESAVEVLDDLLNYDKIEAGALRLEFSAFSMWELIRKITSVMQIQAQQKNIRLELEIQGDTDALEAFCRSTDSKGAAIQHQSSCETVIVGDVYRMGQVLRNLISNALKFTATQGTVSITVERHPDAMADAPLPAQAALKDEFASLRRAGSIIFSVTDSGAGLTPEQLVEICTEGVQFNANELQAGQGSGLGLFISKGIVEQHGGKLTVASEGLGKGATFSLEMPLFFGAPGSTTTLPINPRMFKQIQVHAQSNDFSVSPSVHLGHTSTSEDQAPPTSAATAPSCDALTACAAPTKRMLVVDDSVFNRKLLCRLLSAKGFICESAEDGAMALEAYAAMRKKHVVDAVLMDFEMPVMNGPTATKRLREMGCTCLIVGVTGNVLPDEMEYFKRHGADAVMPKPFKYDVFESLLNDAWDPKRPSLHPDDRSASFREVIKADSRSANYVATNVAEVHPIAEHV